MARAEAGKLASRLQRRRGRCRLRQPKRQPEVSRGCRGSILQMLKLPIVRSRGWHAQKPGMFATHERRPVGQQGIL